MLNDQQINKLNTLLNHFRTVGVQYSAIRRDFMSDGDKGMEMFLYNEMKERYGLSEDIMNFLQEHDSSVVFAATPAAQHPGPVPNALAVLINKDTESVNTIKSFISEEQDPETAYVKFLKKLLYCSEMELKEVIAINDKLSKVINSPWEMMVFDEWLVDKYSGHSHDDY